MQEQPEKVEALEGGSFSNGPFLLAGWEANRAPPETIAGYVAVGCA